MKKPKIRYRNNPPTIEMPEINSEIGKPSDAYKEKDSGKKAKINSYPYEEKDTGIKKKKEEAEDSAAFPLIIGFGTIAIFGFALWAISRQEPIFGSPGVMQPYPQQLSTAPTSLAGLNITGFTPMPFNIPDAPTWTKNRTQIEVPDGTQAPQSYADSRNQGSTPSTQSSPRAAEKVSIVIIYDFENPERGERITDLISTWLGSHSIVGNSRMIANAPTFNALRGNISEDFNQWNGASPRTRFIVGNVTGTGAGRKIDFYYIDESVNSLQGPSSVTIGDNTDYSSIMNTYLNELIRTGIIPGR